MLRSVRAMKQGTDNDMFLPDFDIQNVDDDIRGAVLFFQEAGFTTITSCEGGEGHAFKLPTVGLLFDRDDKIYDKLRIIEGLLEKRGFAFRDSACRMKTCFNGSRKGLVCYVEGDKLKEL